MVSWALRVRGSRTSTRTIPTSTRTFPNKLFEADALAALRKRREFGRVGLRKIIPMRPRFASYYMHTRTLGSVGGHILHPTLGAVRGSRASACTSHTTYAYTELGMEPVTYIHTSYATTCSHTYHALLHNPEALHLSNHERAYRVRCDAGVALGTQLLSLDLRIPVCSLLVAWAWTGSPGSVRGDPMRCDAMRRPCRYRRLL